MERYRKLGRPERAADLVEGWTTPTNSGTDSRGVAFGRFEGDDFIIVVIAALVGVVIFTLLLVTRAMTLGMAFFWGFFPFAGAVAYLLLFRTGKPRHYDWDLFEEWVLGQEGAACPRRQPRHPFVEAGEMDVRNRMQAARRRGRVAIAVSGPLGSVSLEKRPQPLPDDGNLRRQEHGDWT